MTKVADRVKEFTTGTGTGTVSLGGAATGYRAFSAAFSTGDEVYYCIEDGTNWEVGYGTLTAGSPWTLSRNLLASSTGSLINFSAGSKNVFCTAPAALVGASVGVTGNKNAVINGGMLVAQRADLTLGSAAPAANAGYGKVDRFQAWGTGSVVSAGVATQDTSAGIGRTGYALKLSGVTITGTGIAFMRHRIESKNALRFKNQAASLSCVVKHDVGSSINYTLTVRKANAVDNFSAVTDIQAGSPTAVTSATETTLKLENISMGDCSNGIEIEVKAACGAITTKNFWLTEVQLELGASATTFDYGEVSLDFAKCLRYYETNNGAYGPSYALSSTVVELYLRFTGLKRTTPTVTSAGGTNDVTTWMNNASFTSSSSSAAMVADTHGLGIQLTASGLTPSWAGRTNCPWYASAEL